MSEDSDQDKLAAEWAAAMEEQGDDEQDDIDALLAGSDAAPAAPAPERAHLDEFDPVARGQDRCGCGESGGRSDEARCHGYNWAVVHGSYQG